MERSKEILDILGKLEETVSKGNEVYQQLFDFHKVNSATEKRVYDEITSQVGIIVKHITSKRKTQTEHLLSKISNSLFNVPNLLMEIKTAIERSSNIQAAIQGAMAGQGDTISSLKGLANQKQGAALGKLETMFKGANKSIESPSEKRSKDKSESANLSGIKPSELKTVTVGLKNIGNIIKTFIHAFKEYTKIQDKVKVEQLTNDIVSTIQMLSTSINKSRVSKKRIEEVMHGITKGFVYFIHHVAGIKKSVIKHFSFVAEHVVKSFGKLVDLLTKIIEKKERYDQALNILTMILKVIKKMQIGFFFAALMFPILPFAMFTFARMFEVANAVGWFGLPIIKSILFRGADTLKHISGAIFRMSLSFWVLGRIMRKYDVISIVAVLHSMFGLFNKVAAMKIKYKIVQETIYVFKEFMSGIVSSFVSFDTVSALLKTYKPADISMTMENMSLIINKSFDLFDSFIKYKTSYRKVQKSLDGFILLFENIPYLVWKIAQLSDYIKKRNLDKRAIEMKRVMKPIMDLINMMSPKYIPKLLEIFRLKSAYKAIIDGTNILINGLGKISESKIKMAVSKIKSIKMIFDTMFNLFKDINKHQISILRASKTTKHMAEIGVSAFKMTLMFTFIAPLSPIAMIGLLFTVASLKFLKLASHGAVSLMKLAAVMMLLSPAIIIYSLALLISGMLLKKIDYVSLFLGLGALIIVALAFGLIGKQAGRIALGSLVVMLMSIALVVFSIGLLVFGAVVKMTDIGTLLLGSVVLLAYGVVFTLIGVGVTSLAGAPLLGVLAVLAMSIALVAFSIGLLVFSAAVKMTDVGTLLLGSVVLLAYGIVFTLIGVGVISLAGAPIVGAITVALMGVGLLLFSIGLTAFGLALKTTDITQLLLGALVILGLGIAFAIVGVLSILIIPGAVAVMLMGISLPFFALGLGALSLLPPLDIKNILFVGLAMVVFAIGYAILGALSPLILLGVVSVFGISVSFPFFVLALSSLTLLDKVEWKSIGKLAAMMGILAAGYTALGLLSPLILPGIFTMFGISHSLRSIMGTLKETMTFDWNKIPLEQIQKVLTGLAAAFASVGMEGQTGLGGFLIGIANAVGIGPKNVQKGIDSVLGAGKALMSITEGLVAFNEKAVSIVQGANGIEIMKNIVFVVGKIREAFANVGNDSEDFFGLKITRSSVEKGINSVRNVGETLKSIADGLAKWGDLSKMGLSDARLKEITKNIEIIVGTIAKTFEAIGNGADHQTGFLGLWTTKAAGAGIASVKGLGNVLKEIADGIAAFANLEKLGFKPNSFDPKTKGSIASNMMEILAAVTKLFGELGSKGKTYDMTNPDGSKGKIWLPDESVKRGIDSVKGVGDILTGIGNSLKSFITVDENKLETIKRNITAIITLIAEVFSSIGSGENPIINSNSVKLGVSAIQGVGKELEAISKSLQPYMDLQTKKIDIKKLKSNIKDILTTTMTFLGAIGVIQNENDPTSAKFGMEYFGSDWWLMKKYFIKDGISVLKEASSGLEFIQKASDVVKNIAEQKSKINFNELRKYLCNVIKIPIDVIAEAMVAYKYENVMQWLNDFLPLLKTRLSELLTLGEKNYNGVIGNLNIDLKKFIKDSIGAKIENKQMDAMEKIVQFFERLSKIDDPFSKFAKTFKSHVGDFKEYVKYINSIDLSRITAYSDLNYKMTELVKNDPVMVSTNAESIKSLIKEISIIGQGQNGNQIINNYGSNMYGGETQSTYKENTYQKENNETEIAMSNDIGNIKSSIDKLYGLFLDGRAKVMIKTGTR